MSFGVSCHLAFHVISAIIAIIVTKVFMALMVKVVIEDRCVLKKWPLPRIVIGRYCYKSSFGANKRDLFAHLGTDIVKECTLQAVIRRRQVGLNCTASGTHPPVRMTSDLAALCSRNFAKTPVLPRCPDFSLWVEEVCLVSSFKPMGRIT